MVRWWTSVLSEWCNVTNIPKRSCQESSSIQYNYWNRSAATWHVTDHIFAMLCMEKCLVAIPMATKRCVWERYKFIGHCFSPLNKVKRSLVGGGGLSGSSPHTIAFHFAPYCKRWRARQQPGNEPGNEARQISCCCTQSRVLGSKCWSWNYSGMLHLDK